MNQNTFLTVSGSIFFVVALLHLWRAVNDIDVMFGVTVIPLWLSWSVVVVLGYLAYQGLRKR